MRVGVPKEIKDHEDRVGLVPSSVAELVHHGHEVLVERGAGVGAGLGDDQYGAAGARIVDKAEEVFAESEMIVKVKEPLAVERKRLRRGQVLFTYLHLAPDREQTEDLLKSGVTAIAYETVTSPYRHPAPADANVGGRRPARAAGRRALPRARAGGRGVLLGGVPGVPPAEVVVLGGGVSGTHAATIALGMGATVFVVDRSAEVLRRLAAQFPGLRTIFSTRDALGTILRRADLLVGAVLVPGAAAPKLVTREMVASMKPNSVIVDIAIDQGGCCETSQADLAFESDLRRGRRDPLLRHQHAGRGGAHLDIRAEQRHPAVRLTLADKGWRRRSHDDPHLRNGLNVHEGKVTCRPVAEALGLPFTSPEAL